MSCAAGQELISDPHAGRLEDFLSEAPFARLMLKSNRFVAEQVAACPQSRLPPTPPRRNIRMREQSTLHLTRTSVSWLSRGSQPEVLRRGLSSAEVPVAIEAKAMLKESGQRAGACTLALDESHYKRRQLDLPAGLVARELTQVLSRKADALVGSEDKAVFYAIPLHGNRKSRSEGKRAWLLYAIGSKKLTVLTDELRRAGFRVKRIVAAEVAYHGGLSLPTLDKTEAAIQIGQLESGIGVSLFSKSGLVSQNVVPTGQLRFCPLRLVQ